MFYILQKNGIRLALVVGSRESADLFYERFEETVKKKKKKNNFQRICSKTLNDRSVCIIQKDIIKKFITSLFISLEIEESNLHWLF